MVLSRRNDSQLDRESENFRLEMARIEADKLIKIETAKIQSEELTKIETAKIQSQAQVETAKIQSQAQVETAKIQAEKEIALKNIDFSHRRAEASGSFKNSVIFGCWYPSSNT